MPIEQAEFNTIITFLGMLCATVQGAGVYAALREWLGFQLALPFVLGAWWEQRS